MLAAIAYTRKRDFLGECHAGISSTSCIPTEFNNSFMSFFSIMIPPKYAGKNKSYLNVCSSCVDVASVISLKREAEDLPELSKAKNLELKEKLIYLAHLLAQMKIALVTQDEEKLAHVIEKFQHGDVCGMKKVKAEIQLAKKNDKGNALKKYNNCCKKIEKEFTLFVKEAAINI